ncbi:sulfurtransferase [Aquiflexum lacus]|uniref:sulfurtransferase n=1 Tax=Aquiflexum lacus TaxID=2483805 RepID=UPI00189490E8|nr:sulfurtransferase [Aquiflexum lacus]
MTQYSSPIISPEALLDLKKNKMFILIDASFGKSNYLNKHLKGALHVDLNTELSDIKEDFANGGRHPLPSEGQFCSLLSRLGISPESHVVVYDDKNGSNAASRFWWMMKSIGHPKIQVLDGGLDAAIKAGITIARGENTEPIPSSYPKQNEWILPEADLSEVEKVSLDKDYLVIDVRESERYNGVKEPIDLVAGHIPGAVNIPFSLNLNPNGFFKSPEELKVLYSDILKNKPISNIIVHCGSGVTACHTLLAFAHAGIEIPKLYVGSWSEWSRNNKPIAQES